MRRLAPGDEIGGFRLIENVHSGALGTLWSVSQPDDPTPLLMKLPFLLPGEDPLAIVSYETEQMIMPRLSGGHVPRFVAAGDFGGPYLVMERIAGKSRMSFLPNLPLPIAEVAELGARIADALTDVHRQRVLHLDLKPSNIMTRDSDGEAVLLDFGLSRHLDLPDLLGEEIDGPIGTGVYIAPEQVLGRRDDPRSDHFALGVLLYFFATGVRPFGEPRTVGQWRKRLTTEPVPPRRLRADLPPWLQEIILHCLEVDPRNRYQSAAHLAFDLRHPELVRLTPRADRMTTSGIWIRLLRWIAHTRNSVALGPEPAAAPAIDAHGPPIIMAAVDLDADHAAVAKALIATVEQLTASAPGARIACVNILKLARLAIDRSEDAEGRNLHLLRLAQLKHWAAPLQRFSNTVTYHVIEAADPAAALIEFAERNHVRHLVMGCRGVSALRRYLGSVSTKVVAEAPCTVTVVRA
jgi:eukaryotic-like serine/threonine-protein kinase